ncbi:MULTISPECIES: NADH-quinone oxidoreductase subunit M [unclassified Nitratiruptor]|uniref:NADH-quinone oxidoreductase subunit M n=1 Tax=unclassified Nitratiruptor TaxID=2624044 RepID=UPI001916242C|nr:MULTISPECIES: NADH-quinone oxidoreductase subunit M [unclassified Nitratiruptor]BCD59569.1 NADH-quinone oxidoreductase subunit M [Nitratiruptor sp. YY08-10]BCD63493.1 NADH-quinone oxidoreductase subunit M [Nitratiruptor sp. YY08-14]
MDHILSLLVFFPALAGMLGFIVKKDNIRAYGITIAAIEFALSLILWLMFDYNNGHFQFVEQLPLIPEYGINYFLGVDGISLFLIVLSTFVTLVGLISLTIEKNVKNMIISLLFLEMTMVGVFVALDAVIFYIFWELSLVPMLYIIGYWGSELRVYAAIKFFLYTFFGSLIMLVGMLFMAYLYYVATGTISFAIPDWHRLILPYDYQIWLFLAFFLGLAIKVPMFPFHTWLPYAHGQAPTIGSVILAAVLLKMGTYGFVRLSLPLFPDASIALITPIAVIAVVMVIYTAMVAYAQEDMKQVIAYSSISHMGVIILGTFAMNVEGIAGSIFLMISHGIVSGALFMLVGNIYDRRHTKKLVEFGGLASVMPKYALIFGIMTMASVGLPLTIGFVGEFLSLMGFYKVSPALAFLGGFSIILGAAYMLRVYKLTFFGPLTNEKNRNLPDLNWKELTSLISLVVVVIWLGVNPNPVLKPINKSVENMLQLMEKKAITPEAKDLLSHNTVKLEAK